LTIEDLLFNLLILVIGVAVGSMVGTEIAIRRVSRSLKKIINRISKDSELKDAFRRLAEESFRYMLKILKEELTKSSQSTEEELKFPQIPEDSG